jgi:hypothetical protein
MAFNRNKLVLVSEHGVPSAPKLYLYTTTDTIATVNTADYFLSASRILNVGDMLIIASSTGGTREISFAFVNAVTIDTTVDINDGLSLISGAQAGAKTIVQGIIPDVGTAAAIFLMAPVAGTISLISTKLGGALASADATIACKVNAGTTMGSITITSSGSAVGDLDTLAPSAENTVAVGDWIRLDTDGGGTGPFPLSVAVEISPTVGVDSD